MASIVIVAVAYVAYMPSKTNSGCASVVVPNKLLVEDAGSDQNWGQVSLWSYYVTRDEKALALWWKGASVI